MTTRTDSTGRRIPPPPARSFAPAGPAPAYAPTRQLTHSPDTRHGVGNISARTRRAGTPATTAEWRRLMAAPAGR